MSKNMSKDMFAESGRTPGAKKAKLKGHNPDYNAAYHYGSDFEGEEEYEENENDKSQKLLDC